MMIVGYDHNILGHFTAITKEPHIFLSHIFLFRLRRQENVWQE
jgi:hypothetical protein